MATANDILIDVRNQLKETSPAFWTNTEILRLINRGVQDFLGRTRTGQNKAMLSLEVGRSSYPLPADWLSARLVMHKQVVEGTANWRRVYPTNLEKQAQEDNTFMDESTEALDRPSRYFIWGGEIYVTPAPSAENVSDSDLVLWYVSKPSAIVNFDQPLGIDESLVDAITAYVLWKAWKKEEEVEAALEEKETYFDFVRQGRRFMKLRVGDERKMIDIESPQGFRQTRNPFDPLS